MEAETERPKRRWKRRLAIMVACLVAVTVAVLVWAVLTRRGVDARLAEIRAAGDPASILELAPKPIPDVENAAAQLAAIVPDIRQFASDHGAFYKTEVGKAYDAAPQRGEPATAEQLAAIRAIVEKHPEIDAGLAKAAACPQYVSRLDFSLDHQMLVQALIDLGSDARTAARFVGWQMEVATGAGQPEGAINKGITLLQIAKLYESEPSLLSFQFACALRMTAVQGLHAALASGPIPAELSDRLDAELAKQDDLQGFADMLKTERAVSITTLEEQFKQTMPPMLYAIGPYSYYTVGVLEGYARLLPRAMEPWHVINKLPPDEQPFRTPSGLGVMTDLLLPALQSTYESANRDVAATRALRVFNALHAYAAANGREATGLADLDLPKAAIVDPFSGAPLIAKHTDRGWLVYSVAKNGVDDGGDFEDQKDYGVGPPRERDAE